MELTEPEDGTVFKIKLTSGRVLGPLSLDRVRLFVLKGQITGSELARKYPQGEWQDINQIPEIAELLVAKAEGKLSRPGPAASGPSQSGAAPYRPISGNPLKTLSLVEDPEGVAQGDVEKGPEANPDGEMEAEDRTIVDPLALKDLSNSKPSADRSSSKLELEQNSSSDLPLLEEEDKTIFAGSEKRENAADWAPENQLTPITQEETVVFQRSSLNPESGQALGNGKRESKELFRKVLLGLVVALLGYNLLLDNPKKNNLVRNEPIRPKLPTYIHGKPDPSKSIQIYNEAMKYYVADTVLGYKLAADKLRASASYDISNVRALAMLASSYLNLIDSSNKDENYFSVISKLIEMSRAKNVDLPEAVIADVEFYLVVNKVEAAQDRIVEYTKSHENYGFEMFYYIALSFFARGDAQSAAKYAGQFPDAKAFSAKIFFLRGLIAEKLKDLESAMREYRKAVQFNPTHAKSHLKIAELLNSQGELKRASPHLEFIMENAHLLPPKELGQAYYLHSQLSQIRENWDLALGDIERSVKLDPENHDYLLELYTLRARAGDSIQSIKSQARMYYFMSEGEKLIQLGRYQDALVPLLQARQEQSESPLPLVKIGDMFSYLHDVENAKLNYKQAAQLAPQNIQIWSKYINSLIQSFEWEEASLAMDKFRKLPVSQSAIDKAAADMYQRQGRYVEAQTLYRKAMGRDSIDSGVYLAYAKSLVATKNFKDAPFFFALALRFDPLNIDAVIGTAKCVAETDSIDRAISMLQNELKQKNGARAEFLAGIAEFQIQKGDWEQAQQNLEQAKQADPQYALTWKLQAQIYMNREGIDKDALEKALLAYQSFSERNASDPSGYFERYKIFVKKTEFEKAKEELNRIYSIYPKYPNLHYYLGLLYSIQGNHKAASEELKRELANNPGNIQTSIAYGKELLELNQIQEALVHFTKAMQADPRSADAKQNAGWASYQLKNYQAAVALLKAALAIDQANPAIYKRLGIVYRDMGDVASACGAFKKYLEMEPDAPDKAQFSACL